MLIPHQKPTPNIGDLFFGALNYLIRRKANFKHLRRYLPEGNYYWTSSGRNALYWILKNEKVDLAYLPSFTCHVVLDAIKRLNTDVEFIESNHLIDIDNLIKILNKKYKKTIKKALVLPYNFGFMPDMDRIVKICRDNKILLVEDCAQALGAEYKGKLAGSFGDYAFFSFGISKNIGYGNGMIVTKNILKINETKKYPLFKTMINNIQAKSSSIFFNKACYSLFYVILKKKLGIPHKDMDFKASELGKYIVMQQAKRYDKILKLRRNNAEYCINELEGIVDFIKPVTNNNPSWLYFIIKSKERERLRKMLFKERVDVQPLLTFSDLSNGLASKFEKEYLSFALYRSRDEITYICDKIKRCK